MLNVVQFRYLKDNLAYLIVADSQAFAVDPGAYRAMLDYLHEHALTLKGILSTHSHADHLLGLDELTAATNAPILRFPEHSATFPLGNSVLTFYRTPGHCPDSVCVYTGAHLISADTLFIGGCGRTPQSELPAMYASLCLLAELPGETIVYPGHDYVEATLAWVRSVDPDNADTGIFPRSARVQSTIAWEKRINPFLRCDSERIRSFCRDNGMPATTNEQCFASLRLLKDNYRG